MDRGRQGYFYETCHTQIYRGAKEQCEGDVCVWGTLYRSETPVHPVHHRKYMQSNILKFDIPPVHPCPPLSDIGACIMSTATKNGNGLLALDASAATITTARVNIRTLRVGSKQLTQSVFRQLPARNLVDVEVIPFVDPESNSTAPRIRNRAKASDQTDVRDHQMTSTATPETFADRAREDVRRRLRHRLITEEPAEECVAVAVEVVGPMTRSQTESNRAESPGRIQWRCRHIDRCDPEPPGGVGGTHRPAPRWRTCGWTIPAATKAKAVGRMTQILGDDEGGGRSWTAAARTLVSMGTATTAAIGAAIQARQARGARGPARGARVPGRGRAALAAGPTRGGADELEDTP